MPETALLQSQGLDTRGGEPVFAAPWEAKAFALANGCHAAGLFTWPEWAQALATAIRAAPQATYYAQWLSALETLLADTGTVPQADRIARRNAWARAQAETPHGEPVVLERGQEEAP